MKIQLHHLGMFQPEGTATLLHEKPNDTCVKYTHEMSVSVTCYRKIYYPWMSYNNPLGLERVEQFMSNMDRPVGMNGFKSGLFQITFKYKEWPSRFFITSLCVITRLPFQKRNDGTHKRSTICSLWENSTRISQQWVHRIVQRLSSSKHGTLRSAVNRDVCFEVCFKHRFVKESVHCSMIRFVPRDMFNGPVFPNRSVLRSGFSQQIWSTVRFFPTDLFYGPVFPNRYVQRSGFSQQICSTVRFFPTDLFYGPVFPNRSVLRSGLSQQIYSTVRFVPKDLFNGPVCPKGSIQRSGLSQGIYSTVWFVPRDLFNGPVCPMGSIQRSGLSQRIYSTVRFVPRDLFNGPACPSGSVQQSGLSQGVSK